jgi:hypothetical protein
LLAQDIEVTLSKEGSSDFNGTDDLSGYTSILHLLGSEANHSYQKDLPAAAQTALVGFVNGGGTYIGSEWLGFMAANEGLLKQMRDLVLINRVSGTAGPSTWTPTMNHPVLNGITGPVAITGSYTTGGLYQFSTNPATTLMKDANNNVMVAVRSLGQGKVVHLASALTDSAGTLQLAPLQLLIANAAMWGN